jgi:hypothetical protein
VSKEDKLKQALLKDFEELLQEEFTIDWRVRRVIIKLYLSVMSLDNTMQMLDKLEDLEKSD